MVHSFNSLKQRFSMLICKPVINQYYYCSTHLKLDKEKKRQFIIKIPLSNIEYIYLFLKQNTKDKYKKMKGIRNLKVQNKSLRQLRFTKKRRLDRATNIYNGEIDIS